MTTLDPKLAATLTALCRVHSRDGRASVATERHRSLSTTHAHLSTLAALDLVAIGPAGGLRPLVRWVPLHASR